MGRARDKMVRGTLSTINKTSLHFTIIWSSFGVKIPLNYTLAL